MNKRQLRVRLSRKLGSITEAIKSPSPLASKLLRLIFGFYFGIAFFCTCVQLAYNYLEELEGLESEIEGIVELILPALSEALWNFDETSMNAIVQAVYKNSAVTGLYLGGDIVFSLGVVGQNEIKNSNPARKRTASVTQLYRQSFPIVYTDDFGNTTKLGKLIIFSDSNVVFGRAKGTFYNTIISAIIKTFFLWSILYGVLICLIARPIKALALRLNKINRELSDRGLIAASQDQNSQDDELVFLLRSFIAMRRALKRAHRKLLKHQQELEQKIAERTKELQYQATHDSLTGLLNRRAFENSMSCLVRSDNESDGQHVLCFIDLDYFKLVNDTLGHAAGDQVLQQVAEILRSNLRNTDLIARLGGDEFAIVLFNCSVKEAQLKIEKLRDKINKLVVSKDGQQVSIGMSAGLIGFSARITQSTLSQALSRADQACYHAKESGRNQVRSFELSDATSMQRRKTDVHWMQTITRALAEDHFLLYFQPIIPAQGHKKNGVRCLEILVRLKLEGEIIPPGRFMPAAEHYKLATRIDLWVVSHTLAFLSAHSRLLEQLDRVHINLCAATISDESVYEFILQQFQKYAVPFHKICFEITETMAVFNFDRSVRIIEKLRQHGIKFALDDFGSGMASFAYLRDLPVDIVKIDGSFVRRISDSNTNLAIVASVNQIAHLENKLTVAEFVENELIMNKLIELKVDYMQGFYLGEPASVEDLLY